MLLLSIYLFHLSFTISFFPSSFLYYLIQSFILLASTSSKLISGSFCIHCWFILNYVFISFFIFCGFIIHFIAFSHLLLGQRVLSSIHSAFILSLLEIHLFIHSWFKSNLFIYSLFIDWSIHPVVIIHSSMFILCCVFILIWFHLNLFTHHFVLFVMNLLFIYYWLVAHSICLSVCSFISRSFHF